MSWYTRTDEEGATWISLDRVFWVRSYEWDKRPTGHVDPKTNPVLDILNAKPLDKPPGGV